MLNNVTLEELIALKLELSSKTLGTPLFGLPIWKHLGELTEEAVLMFAISITETPAEAASFIGLTPYKFQRLCKKYRLFNYFNREFDRRVKEKKERLKALGEANGTTKESN